MHFLIFTNIYLNFIGCSRLHARIAFDSYGSPWLRDLGSGNGTTVNKKPLPKQSIGKFESSSSSDKEGSRGVMVYPGDVFQFGASTRIFVLNGPSYFDRGAVKARRQIATLQKQQQQRENETLKNETIDDNRNSSDQQPNGVSWGMNFDDNDEHENDNDFTSSSSSSLLDSSDINQNNTKYNHHDLSSIPEKYNKLRDKVQAKKYKLNNIELEMRRIQAKSVSMELSSGQQSQLERNEKQLRILQNEISILENELFSKLDSKGTSSNKNVRKIDERDDTYGNYDDDDVDDFYDQTKMTKRQRLDNDITSSIMVPEEDTETLESLTSKWKSLLQKSQSSYSRLKHLQLQVNEIKQEILDKKMNGGGDDDCFFLKNDLEIVSDQVQKVQGNIADDVKEVASIERLMLIINDKLVFDRDLLFIGTEAKLNEQKRTLNSNSLEHREDLMMPPPPQRPLQRKESSHEESGIDLMPPPPPPIHMKVGQAFSGPQNISPSSSVALKSDMKPRSKRIQKGPSRPSTVGTLQVLQQASVQSPIEQHEKTNKVARERQSDQNMHLQKSISSHTMDPKVDQWVAPKEQDGSGKTKLNAKFGGRY